MLKAWAITTGIFFAGDIVWLYGVMNRFFVPQIKHLMNVSDSAIVLRYFSALVAYLLISTALTLFVVIPLINAPIKTIFVYGAFLGLCMYGVYEFTNHATLYNWPLSFLVVDIMWGTLWSGLVAVLTVMLMRAL